MSTPTSFNEVVDPGGLANNRQEGTYNVAKGLVDLGYGILAVGDQFLQTSSGTTLTVQSIKLQFLGNGVGSGGNANNDTVTFTNGTSIPIGTLLAWNWAGGSYTTPQYKRTYAASQLSAKGHQYPATL